MKLSDADQPVQHYRALTLSFLDPSVICLFRNTGKVQVKVNILIR